MNRPPEISAHELAQLLALPADSSARPRLLDVRFLEEHEHVALADSLLIPLPELQSRAAELEVLRGHPVVVYCHHGVRSLHGAAFLLQLGYPAVSLAGGIDAYATDVDPGLPRY